MYYPCIVRKGLLLAFLLASSCAFAGPLEKMANYAEVFGLGKDESAKNYSVQEIATSAPANVLWPGDNASFNLQFTNKTNEAIAVEGKLEIINYGTYSDPQNSWNQLITKYGVVGTLPLKVNIAAKSYVNVKVTPTIPEKFGPYALVVDLPGMGRAMAVCCVRVPEARAGRVQYPSFAMDLQTDSYAESAMFKRLGIKGMRIEWGYKPTTDRDYYSYFARLAGRMKFLEDNDITVMLTSGGGGPQPLGIAPRSYLDADGVITPNAKGDMAWLPESDDDFQQYIKIIASTFGWPRGPLNAIELWNEPWEGRSISGWGADMLRYREIYTRMAQGIEEARKETNVQVLIGGTCSSMNTYDKLFAEGFNDSPFLKWLDFTSIHYQPMGAVPALTPEFMTRKSPNGAVRVWDTESWVANSEERVAAVIASMRAQGQSRTAGVFHDVVREIQNIRYQTPNGLVSTTMVQTLATGAGIAATQNFIGERQFKEILFKNGLPWIFSFDGLPNAGKQNPDDGTLVIVGDLGGVYERDYLLFRSTHGVKNVALISDLKGQIAALPANALAGERQKLQATLKTAEILVDATMKIPDNGGTILLYDCYGNLVPATAGQITIPLNGLGYFLRTDSSTGSFAKMLDTVKNSQIDGIEPLDVQAHDLTARVESNPNLRLTLTNVLNRTISGKLTVKLGELTLEPATQEVTFAPFETKQLQLKVSAGKSSADNGYPYSLIFDAGKDGKSLREEILHCNVIVKKSITVDGKLDDWADALPQPVTGKDIPNPNLTEKAWFPFEKLETPTGKGFAIGYLAYDENNFYFASKIADDSPYDGNVRFATRNDDEYFYPEKSYMIDQNATLQKKDMVWANKSMLPGALRLPNTKEGLLAGWETTTKSFAFDINLTDEKAHQLALYFYDVDDLKRRNTKVEIIDSATGKLLLKQDVNNIADGKYAVFNIAGKVRVKLTSNNWLTATISGIFFDQATPIKPLTGNAAEFVKFDTTTLGSWQDVYGADGYNIITAAVKYPAYATITVIDDLHKTELVWPEGVRRFSYSKPPDIPSGNGTDNVLIAFNALPITDNGWYPNPPGTMPRYMNYRDTNYEYALNQVAAKYNDGKLGTEIWRLYCPGMVRKHFFPRQPKSPFDGAVENGKLAIIRDGNSRIVECAIPWAEIPDVKKRLDAGELIKFSFRVNDNGRIPAYELAMGRSVSKINNYAFHNDWESSWANEVEFGFEK